MADELYGTLHEDGSTSVTTSFEVDAEHIGSIEDGDILVVRTVEMWPPERVRLLVEWFAEHGKRVQVLVLPPDDNIELLTQEAMEVMGWVRRDDVG